MRRRYAQCPCGAEYGSNEMVLSRASSLSLGGNDGIEFMKLAIMQPYFFPYIGYWQLISAADSFVLLDDTQYIERLDQ